MGSVVLNSGGPGGTAMNFAATLATSPRGVGATSPAVDCFTDEEVPRLAALVSITGDPTTPYDAGIRLAEALGGSLLIVEGEQHTVVAAGTNACVADIAAAYLVDLRAPPVDARCTP
jgi:hypothetical protein